METPSPAPMFDGSTFVAALDLSRLSRQLDKVKVLMLDGKHRTLREIGAAIKAPGSPEPVSDAAVSARLRDLRKERFGSYPVRKARRGDASLGIWEYWLETMPQEAL